jgi:NAD+ kinase
LTVNSDPATSVGHFTRATALTVGEVVAAWKSGRHLLESVPRLEVSAAGQTYRVLNDCLFSSTNPAAMTRYQLEIPEGRELQRSSGVWVATAAGSSGAIHSAGARPVQGGPALLYRVREPFLGRGPATLVAGVQQPPQWLRLTPAAPDIALYLDGPNITVPLHPGDTAEFRPAVGPLHLVTLP